jgi:hypothetical protein
MLERNYEKEIAEHERQIKELRTAQARAKKAAPNIEMIGAAILASDKAMKCLAELGKDEVKLLAETIADRMPDIVISIKPDLDVLREKRRKQSEARKARRAAAATRPTEHSEADSTYKPHNGYRCGQSAVSRTVTGRTVLIQTISRGPRTVRRRRTLGEP